MLATKNGADVKIKWQSGMESVQLYEDNAVCLKDSKTKYNTRPRTYQCNLKFLPQITSIPYLRDLVSFCDLQ